MAFWREPITVAELTSRIKESIEVAFRFVTVQGEVSNVKRHSSGHTYFTMKDEKAQISAVLWRSRAASVPVELADGMNVLVTGRLTVYEPRGTYQIEVLTASLVGVGELQQLFERLKRKLLAEGLFDTRHKKALPKYPEQIGIVTSPTGAVIMDMIQIIRRRFPPASILLYPVRVQGAGAAAEIEAAIRSLNDLGGTDVLIVGRGGGSMEDLWAFNEERVARAIFESTIPVISAVGHEVDFTISDFVADLRAPTPSAAAELVVPDKTVLLDNLTKHRYTMSQIVQVLLEEQRATIQEISQSHAFNKPLDRLRQAAQKMDELERTLTSLTRHRLAMLHGRVKSIADRVSTLSPRGTLKRGYALVYHGDEIITRAAALALGERIRTEFDDGSIHSVISGVPE